ncbi:MAG TPA: alpha/beta fold hydrolase [Acidimicrobiales bacterium]|jgi:carboxylesterase
MSEILAGAEPVSYTAPSAPDAPGALVLHGFTGSPQSVRGLADAFVAEGFSVELPLLPGHGTTIEDMIPTGWSDWVATALDAHDRLAARCSRVVVAALSMGGALACRVALDRPTVVGMVLVNPVAEPPGEALFEILRASIEQGLDRTPGIGSDIAKPGLSELAYDGAPLKPALSMYEGVREQAPRLGEIRCPILLFNAPQDHVVPPSNSDFLAASVSGPVERVTCERSYHVATLDYDREDIETRAVDFARKVTAS